MELLIIDRIEGAYAICEKEDRTTINLHLAVLPRGIAEGDCLRKNANGYVIDREETERRRKSAADLYDRLAKEE